MSSVKTVTANGQSVDFIITVNGDQFEVCHNAKVVLTMPSGISLTGPSNSGSTIINVPQGFYKLTNDTWYIGDLTIAQKLENTFEFTVDDVDLKGVDNRFLISAVLTSACTESSSTDNTATLVIEVVDPCTQVSLSIGVDDDATATSSSDISIG